MCICILNFELYFNGVKTHNRLYFRSLSANEPFISRLILPYIIYYDTYYTYYSRSCLGWCPPPPPHARFSSHSHHPSNHARLIRRLDFSKWRDRGRGGGSGLAKRQFGA